MTNDKTVKIPCKFAIKDELGDLICGNEYSENLADFCSLCGNYVPDYQRSDNVSVENVKIGSEIEMEENKMKNTEIIDKRILLALQMLMDNGEGECSVITFKAGNYECPAFSITVEDLFSLFHKQKAEIERLTGYAESFERGEIGSPIIMDEILTLEKDKIELQKQVDEFKIAYKELVANCKNCTVEKDTVKDIADWLDNEKGYCGLGYLIKKRYGVEVE